MFKELSESLVNPITKIINLSVSQGMFPCAWKSSVIVPIFKSGDPHSASNYRPISILPIVSKVAEKLMAAQITNYLNNSYFALHPMQFGFRANYSTEMANCYFTEKFKSLLDKGGVVGAVFLDLRKAFDTLNHSILLSKLLSFNFSPHSLRWIESYLSGRTQYVSIQNYSSALYPLVFHRDLFWVLYFLRCTSMIFHPSVLTLTFKCMQMTLSFIYTEVVCHKLQMNLQNPWFMLQLG